jgi:drug/metabolite transporter (DMT)-like permease
MLILTACIWGSSFILIKHALYNGNGEELFSPLQVGALRIIIAAAFILPMILRKFNVLNDGKLKYLMAVGVFGNGIPAFLFAIAQTKIPSALAGMLNALVPIFSLLIGLIVFSTRIKLLQVVGVLIGLAGAIGIVLSGGGIGGGEVNLFFAALVVLATICYAISLNVIKNFLQDESALAITGVALVLVSPVGIGILLSTDFFFKMTHTEGVWLGLGAVSILAVLGTSLALIVFNKLVKETSAIFASSVTYLIPIVAIIWGVIDGEVLTFSQVASSVVMLGGIFLINRA